MLGAFASALFCWACYWSIRLAYADHLANERSRPTVERAIRLAPGNPEYYVRLAEADPSSALTAMEKAVALNPVNSSIWIAFARIVAEYYFRRRDQERFWPAMRAALATSYDDVAPLFDECWELAPNPETVLALAIPLPGLPL